MNRDDESPPGGKHTGPERSSPYPVSRLAPAFDLVDVAREIQEADRSLGTVVVSKLDVIAKQIRALQREAQAVLEKARRDLDLHRAECAFVRRPGAVYHLYERGPDRLYLSMLSPEEWNGQPPHRFIGSFRLEVDQSWTPLADVDAQPVRPQDVARRLLAGELPLERLED